MPITSVRRLREGLYLINWSEICYSETKERVVQLDLGDSQTMNCTLFYSGFGTHLMYFIFTLGDSYEGLFDRYEMPVVTVSRNSDPKTMEVHLKNSWIASWKTSIKQVTILLSFTYCKQFFNFKTSNYGLFNNVLFRAPSTFRSFKT